jgi:hypothetical protein
LRENSRLAKSKTSTIDEFESNSQIYINVFERKTRLACFSEIIEDTEVFSAEKEMNTVDILSDDSDKVFEDFGDLMKTVTTLTKKKSGKNAPKRKMILQDLSKSFAI